MTGVQTCALPIDQTNASSIKDTSPKAPSTSAAETMGAKAGENLDIINVPDSVPGSKTIPCGMEGSELSDNTRSKDAHLAWLGNPLKNRYDIPKPGDIKTLKVGDLVASDAIKSKFTQGTAVEVTGYVYVVKSGGQESCNCKTTGQSFWDTHIELTPDNKDTSVKSIFIVEVTPRLREELNKQAEWTTETLHKNILHHTVTIQGWLFYDEIHEPEAYSTNPNNTPINSKTHKGPNFRASCWEIHPITSINVVK